MTTMRAKFMIYLSLFAVSALLMTVGCSATRAGYETAPYESASTDGKFSVREYDAMVLASTKQTDPDGNGGFMKLFRYIDGNNENEQKIAMTTPVFMHADNRMSFVLPEEDAVNPPNPSSEKVSIEEVLAYKAAVIRFNGKAKEDLVEEKTERLREWMEQQDLKADGEAILAQYDPPWTPGPMRKNEVVIPIQTQ